MELLSFSEFRRGACRDSLTEAREEAIASAEAQMQEAKKTEAALTAELEQSKAAVSAAEEAQAELAAKVQESKDAAEAAERFKANLQPSIESFKDRILALEAQFPGDSEQAHCQLGLEDVFGSQQDLRCCMGVLALLRMNVGCCSHRPRREMLKMARMKAAGR